MGRLFSFSFSEVLNEILFNSDVLVNFIGFLLKKFLHVVLVRDSASVSASSDELM